MRRLQLGSQDEEHVNEAGVPVLCQMPPEKASATSCTVCQGLPGRGSARRLRLRSAGEVGARAPPQTPERPEKHETEDHDPDHDLDHSASRLAPLRDEWPGCNDAAGRTEPGAIGRAREQQPDRPALRDQEIAVGAGRAPDGERAFDVALDALVDLDGQQTLRSAVHLGHSLRDDAAHDSGVGGVETLAERSVRTHARPCVSDQRERDPRDDGKGDDRAKDAQVTRCYLAGGIGVPAWSRARNAQVTTCNLGLGPIPFT